MFMFAWMCERYVQFCSCHGNVNVVFKTQSQSCTAKRFLDFEHTKQEESFLLI